MERMVQKWQTDCKGDLEKYQNNIRPPNRMKTALILTTILNLVSFLYTAYLLSITLFVHFANKNLGHGDAYFGDVPNIIYLVLTIVFGLFAGIGWYAFRHPNTHAIFKWLPFLPIGVILLYVLFAVVILVSSGGRWN